MSTTRLFLLVIFLLCSSCIQSVQYEKREIVHEDGTKSEEFISVCPYCKEYADYETFHCINCNRPYFWERSAEADELLYGG